MLRAMRREFLLKNPSDSALFGNRTLPTHSVMDSVRSLPLSYRRFWLLYAGDSGGSMTSRLRLFAGLAVLGSTIVVGCGGDDDDDASSTGGASHTGGAATGGAGMTG